jgi:thiamine-phosphate pyrophosphorylase
MPTFDVILITDEGEDLLPRLERALAHAPPQRVAVQQRCKGRTAAQIMQLARELRALTRRCGASLLINDRVDVALAVDADGVHLPEQGLPIEVARSLVGPQRWLGVSRHDLNGLFEAARNGADYATLSPVHPVPGKGRPLGIENFGRMAAMARLPVYALGGVRAVDVAELRQAGARGVAVIREVLASDNPASALAELLAQLPDGSPT